MIKISKPILYTLLIGGGAALYFLTTPDDPPTKHTKKTAKSAAMAQNGITEADLKAHFARFTVASRDAFAPKVIPKKSSALLGNPNAKNGMQGPTGTWALTGINVINGVRTAVMENGSTHDILSLKPGDSWNGLRVASVGEDSIEVINAQNQKSRITFVDPKADAVGAPVVRADANGANGPAPLRTAPIAPPRGSLTTTSRADSEESVN